MCAINGFNWNDKTTLYRMNDVTKHRGPDGTNVFLNASVSLGHNRLKIIDLSDAASQPMQSNSGRYTIVFNGEIYNYREIKKEIGSSYAFHTHSDTEVILAAYEKWQEKCLEKLDGIFAFAIWDREKEELFLARDHIGVKPLYYFWDGKRFIFSSEIKGILEHAVPRKLNRKAFSHYLRIQYVPEPLTMFDGILKFPPAHYGTLRKDSFTLTPYWNVSHTRASRSKKRTESELADKITSIVGRQLISDRPVGIYLSGGIDSSVVLDAAARHMGAGDIKTFSIGFDVSKAEESDKFNADFNLAKRTAEQYGTTHNEILVSSDDVVDLFESTVIHSDEPISNPTTIAMMKLASFAKEQVAVVLGGDGGDELFGGYERYRLSLIASYYQRMISPTLRDMVSVTSSLKKLNTPPGIDRFALFMFQKDGVVSEIVNDPFFSRDASRNFFKKRFFEREEALPFETVFMDTDRRSWLVDQSLMLSDKMSMSAGLEQRVPLLDRELVEYAATIPLSYKLNPFQTKIILKDAFRGRIPDFLYRQPKRGWFSPGAKWLRHENMRRLATETLSEGYYEGTKDLFRWEAVRRMLDDHCDKRRYNLTMLWTLLTFQTWARMYKVSI